MKVIYIAHPIANNVRKNLRKVERIAFDIISKYKSEIIPLAPYHFYCHILNDANETDREIGQQMNKHFFMQKSFDELWLYGDRISNGMILEISWAFNYNIPIIPCTPQTIIAYKALTTFNKKLDLHKKQTKIRVPKLEDCFG